MEDRYTDGHFIQVGMELEGPGIRIYVDGEDRTDEFLKIVGPTPEDGHGMPMPRGEHWAADVAASHAERLST